MIDRYQNTWKVEGGYTVSIFRGSYRKWVVWVEAPDGRHLFAQARYRMEAKDLSTIVVARDRFLTSSKEGAIPT